MTSEALLKSLKFWFDRGLKDSAYIKSLVTVGKIIQEEADEITGTT